MDYSVDFPSGWSKKMELHIREFRRGVQQIFYGIVSLTDDKKYAEKQTQKIVSKFEFTLRGEQGEVVDDIDDAVNGAIDDVKDFSLAIPEE